MASLAVSSVYADQLVGFFLDFLNMSLSQAIVPTCIKEPTIVPVSKKNKMMCPNDYRPVVLTPVIMKCRKRLVMAHIKASMPVFNISSIKHKGCLATNFCNTTSTSSILGVASYIVSQTCCNGVGSVQLPLTVALGAALVAIWSTFA